MVFRIAVEQDLAVRIKFFIRLPEQKIKRNTGKKVKTAGIIRLDPAFDLDDPASWYA